MHALIHQVPSSPSPSMLSIAGLPLLARQLQWLRSCGVESVAVEICSGSEGDRCARWLQENALGMNVRVVLSAQPLGPVEVAERAGFPTRGVIALPSNVLGNLDLVLTFANAPKGGIIVGGQELSCEIPRGSFTILPGGRYSTAHFEKGWVVEISTPRQALLLGMLVASKQLNGVDIPASLSEQSGVWVARGATVEPGATLIAPVYLGPDSIVRENARVGPFVELGAHSVIERNAEVSYASIDADLLIGEGVSLHECIASQNGIVPFEFPSLEPVTLGDSLLMETTKTQPHATRWLDRIAAALGAFLLLVPWTLVALVWTLRGRKVVHVLESSSGKRLMDGCTEIEWIDVLPRLFDVVLGRRVLVGYRNPLSKPTASSPRLWERARDLPCGALDITAERLASNADEETVLRIRIADALEAGHLTR